MVLARVSLIVLFHLCLIEASAQQEDQRILDIRREFHRINETASLNTLELTNAEFLDNIPDGGGKLTGYFEDNELVKFTEWYGISIGVYETDYYLKDGEIFFFYKRESQFGNKEGGEIGEWDYSKLEHQFEGRYYFESTDLIRRIEDGERLFDDNTDPFEILEAANELAEKLRSKTKN